MNKSEKWKNENFILNVLSYAIHVSSNYICIENNKPPHPFSFFKTQCFLVMNRKNVAAMIVTDEWRGQQQESEKNCNKKVGNEKEEDICFSDKKKIVEIIEKFFKTEKNKREFGWYIFKNLPNFTYVCFFAWK